MSRRTVDIFDRITQIKKKKNCFKYQETDFDKHNTRCTRSALLRSDCD